MPASKPPAPAVWGASYLAEGLSTAQLVKRLTALAEALRDLGQDDRPRGLTQTAAALITERLTAHKDKAVRVLTACCLCDVLRVYAPEAPYSDPELQVRVLPLLRLLLLLLR